MGITEAFSSVRARDVTRGKDNRLMGMTRSLSRCSRVCWQRFARGELQRAPSVRDRAVVGIEFFSSSVCSVAKP